MDAPGHGLAGSRRVDNITDTALRRFRVEYGDKSITKDVIFNYVYGVLHSPHYRDRFTNDLAKGLPRIPFAPGLLHLRRRWGCAGGTSPPARG